MKCVLTDIIYEMEERPIPSALSIEAHYLALKGRYSFASVVNLEDLKKWAREHNRKVVRHNSITFDNITELLAFQHDRMPRIKKEFKIIVKEEQL